MELERHYPTVSVCTFLIPVSSSENASSEEEEGNGPSFPYVTVMLNEYQKEHSLF